MKNIIKICIFLNIFVFTFVYAATCDTVIDPQISDDRKVVCSATSQTITTFSYPATDVEVFKNDLCTIRCNEKLILAADAAKNVLAGMGFNYPLYVSAQRTCNAIYDYETYNTSLLDLISKRKAEVIGSPNYNNYVNQISNALQTKEECDNWKDEEGKYRINPSVNLEVTTSQGIENFPYVFASTSDYNSIYKEETVPYEFCNLNDLPSGECTLEPETVSSWNETAGIYGKYTIKDRYIEKYTGEIKEVAGPNTCLIKDTYFTSFYEKTRPLTGDLVDKGYPIKLTATNLGNNIKDTPNKWSLTVDCWYSLKNLLFPQGANGGDPADENYTKYGSSGFMYRLINLETPFPNRTAGANWYGKEEIITGNVDLSSKVIYEINLDSNSIKQIRDYNDQNPYDTFNLDDMEKSTFIENNINVIKRY